MSGDVPVPWDAVDHAALARSLGVQRAARESAAVAALAELLGVVFRLRDEDGCPWDKSQTLGSMLENLLEEAAETAEAVAADDDAHAAEELGDVLMNVFLMARIAEQERRFDLSAVARGIATKLVRRHEHVFGEKRADDAGAALASWNSAKAKERDAAGSVLDGVPAGLPALLVALRLGEKAARVGFDWPSAAGALDKLAEEADELRAASDTASDTASDAASDAADAASATSAAAARERVEDELGDVLFAAVNVARKHGLDPELALRRTIAKFRRRFAHVERSLGARLPNASLDEMEALWRQAAATESAGEGTGTGRAT